MEYGPILFIEEHYLPKTTKFTKTAYSLNADYRVSTNTQMVIHYIP